MKKEIKKIAKPIIRLLMPRVMEYYIKGLRFQIHKHSGTSKIDVIKRTRLAIPDFRATKEMAYVRQMAKIFKNETLNFDSFYVYPFDEFFTRVVPIGNNLISSITVDYEKILYSRLDELISVLSECKNDEFKVCETRMVQSIQELAERIAKGLISCTNERKEFFSSCFPNIVNRKPETMDEAIQKILFFNALFWQANHWHAGLGRLDKILIDFYRHDVSVGILNRAKAKHMVKELCSILGKDMYFKSLSLKGDTGQYILIGGVDENGQTIQNELTEIFLEVFTENIFPDPKLILRVNASTDQKIWEMASCCILKGSGSPLLMNETLIMDNMVKYGYSRKDVSEVGTSACWEPLVIGKSFDQNNPFPSVVAVKALNDAILSGKEFSSFDSLLDDVLPRLGKEITNTVCDISFDCSPLYTLFFDNCLEREKDYTEGGAKYAYNGLQIVSFPNFINALLNVKSFVYDKNYFSLSDCREAIATNFDKTQELKEVFENNEMKFGCNDTMVLSLTNKVLSYVSHVIEECHSNGNRVKIGISSSNYIHSLDFYKLASLDGRKAEEPFAVHISPISEHIGIQEIIDFASKLDYSKNLLNGNVVDFIVPQAFAKMPEKMATIIKNGMLSGVFEMQLNILDVETLKEAKIHPEKHKDLVVRVWGFSAYFNDLPEEYKDNLIKRAEKYAV